MAFQSDHSKGNIALSLKPRGCVPPAGSHTDQETMASLTQLPSVLILSIVEMLDWKSRSSLVMTSYGLCATMRDLAAPTYWRTPLLMAEGTVYDAISKRAALRSRILTILQSLALRPVQTGMYYDHDTRGYKETPFEPQQEFDYSVGLLGEEAGLRKLQSPDRCPMDALDFFSLSRERFTPAFTDVATQRGCSHCRRGLNRAVRNGVVCWASGSTCLCISAQCLAGAHKDWQSFVFAYIDTEGAATGIPGAVFELETTDEADETMEACTLWTSPWVGDCLPVELRERAILWKAKHDRITYAGHGHQVSPCCGRAAAHSFTDYLERILQASQSGSEQGEGRLKLWRLNQSEELPNASAARDGSVEPSASAGLEEAEWIRAIEEAEVIMEEMHIAVENSMALSP